MDPYKSHDVLMGPFAEKIPADPQIRCVTARHKQVSQNNVITVHFYGLSFWILF